MRKVCIVVNSRANYARIKSVLTAVREHPDLQLQLVVGASALLERFGRVIDLIRADGFREEAVVYMALEGDTTANMVKSTALGMIELSSLFMHIAPDIVLTVADRYETLATAVTASYMNIPLAHTQGGETTGSIDESVRHAITKLAHIHFPATDKARENLIRMGEDPATIYMTGCPALDLVTGMKDRSIDQTFWARNAGVGYQNGWSEPYIVVLQHPVTTENTEANKQIDETLHAVRALGMRTIWMWPNIDAGSDAISKRLRVFHENQGGERVTFYKNFSSEDFIRLIDNSVCMIGNSSSALREGSLLGVPVVNVGSRQQTREHGANVMHADYNAVAIEAAARAQITHGKYVPDELFGDGTAGRQIADILATCKISVQKRLHYPN